MAPTRNQRIARLAATLDGGGEARRVANLRQWADQQGIFAASPGLGAPTVEDAGDKAFKGLKAVGSNVLNALTVPQSALYTTVAKAAGRDTSWKNALGGFVRAENGMSGGDAALNSLGITNQWARLGVSIVVDPLWFVGGALVRAPSKAKAIEKAVAGGKSVKEGTTVLQLSSGRAPAGLLGRGSDDVNWVRGERSRADTRRSVRALIGPGRKQIGPGAGPTKVEKIVENLSTGRPMTVPGLPKSFQSRRVKDAIRLPSVPVERGVKIQFRGRQRPSTGDLVANRYYVVPTGTGAKKRFRIYDLGAKFNRNAPAKATQQYGSRKIRRTKESRKGQIEPAVAGTIIGKSYKNLDEAISAAEDVARSTGHRTRKGENLPERYNLGDYDPGAGKRWTRSGDPYDPDYEINPTDIVLRGNDPKFVAAQQAREEVLDMDWEEMDEVIDTTAEALRAAGQGAKADKIIDDYGNATDMPEMLRRLREALSQHETREGMNYAIKLGAGKFNKKIDLGISAERGFLGRRSRTAFRAGMLGMKPVEKVAHALRRAGSETSEGVTSQILRLADEFGMTEKIGDKTVIREKDATLLGVYRSLRSVNEEAGNTLRDALRREGVWTDNHDAVVKVIDERNAYFQKVDPLKPDKRREELDKARAAAAEKVETAQLRFDKSDSKSDFNKLEKRKEALQKIDDEIKLLEERGPYTKQGRRQADLADEMKKRDEAVLQGRDTGGYKYRRFKDPETRLGERAWLDNPFATVTPQEFIDDLKATGIDDELAESLRELVSAELTRKGLNDFRESAFKHGRPEWNAFLLAGRREQDHIWAQVEEQIDELMRISGITEDTQVGTLLKYGVNREDGSGIAGSPPGMLLLKGIAKFKGFLTFANPSHYSRNLAGDFINSLINGNMRHLSPGGAGYTRSRVSKLANAEVWAAEGRVNHEILEQTFEIGGRTYTGHELLALSRMVGLGRGYVGTDVALMAEAFERARSTPGEMYRFMQRLNIKRENAQRMQTWMRHMHKGDDPITAATKTLRVHFDYTQLTEFEKLMLRNILLFYTWFKRNLILQGTAVVTRPAFTGTFADIEAARPRFENEPDYYSEQMALPVPGIGNLYFGNPVSDLAKQKVGWDSFRRDILGMVTPPIRVPLELGTNQKFFSGGRIQDYEGEVTQNVFADLLGIGTPTRAKEGGEMGRGINPQLAYILSQLTGPQGNTVQSLSNPDYEGSKSVEFLGRFTGITPQQDRKEQFARAAKYLAAKKKADATRARNAQSERF